MNIHKSACRQVSYALILAIAAAMAVLSPKPLAAQQFFGSIVGTVTDTSGAIIPGATVTVSNKATGERHTATSNAAGEYEFVDLLPAVYTVTVERANFKRFVSDTVRVDVNQTVRVNAALQVGAVTETVEVNMAQVVQLQTDSGTVSNRVEAQQVDELPLNGRNMMQLLNVTPGVIPSSGIEQGATMAQNNGTSSNPLSWGGGSNVYTINGGDNEEYLDGAPINMLQGSNIGLMPTADAIQEFNIDTSANGSDEGRSTGGMINFTTKTGTNNFHGTAYEYFENADLNANNFFNNLAGLGRPKLNQNLYGFNLGFPVKKDKIFFFGSYEVDAVLKSAPSLINVPSNGNAYSSNFLGGGNDIWDGIFTRQIVDPVATANGGTGAVNGTTDTCMIEQGETGGVPTWALNSAAYGTPGGCIDPTAAILKTFWAEQPNTTASGTNYAANFPSGDTAPQMNARMDFIISPKQRLFAHTAWWAPLDKPLIPFPNPNVKSLLPNNAPWNLGMEVGGFNSNLYILGDTYTFNPKTVMDLRAEWVRFRFSMIPKIDNFNLGGLDGANSTNPSAWANLMKYFPAGNQYLPGPTLGAGGQVHNLAPLGIGFTNSSSGTWSTGGQGQQWDNYGLNGTLTRVFGRHSLRAGFEARLMDMELLHNSFAAGNPSFGIKYSCVYSGTNCEAGTGDEWAEFLMGYFVGASFAGSYGGTEFNYYQAYFVSDTWQMTPKLTLTFGVRYELPGSLYERKNHTLVLLPYTTDPNTGTYGTEALVNTSLAPGRATTPIKHDIFDPRVGFAYRLDNRTVVRGGFGISQQAVDEDAGGNGAPGAAVNSQQLSWTNPTTVSAGAVTPPQALLQNPVPASAVYVPPLFNTKPNFLEILAQAAQTGGGVALSGNYRNERLPYFEQYNFALQHQIGNSFQATVSFVGSHGVELSPKTNGGVGVDEIPYSAYTVTGAGTFNPNGTSAESAVAATGSNAGKSLTAAYPTGGTINVPASGGNLPVTYANGVYCSPNGAFCNANWTVGQSLEPYPSYKSATISNYVYANQHYNSLQATTQWRIPGGGLIGSALTWAKTIGDNVSQQDYYNHRADRTVQGVPSRLAINVNYPLPIGRGGRFFNISNVPVNTVISGWAINDVTSFQHGGYLAIGSNTANTLASKFGAGTSRASYISGAPGCNSNKVISGSATSRINQWFNTNCFVGVAAGGQANSALAPYVLGAYDFGNENANDPKLFAQGLDNSDIALAKTTKVTEKLNVLFRLETFNTFNRFQASAPANLNAGNSAFGKVTSQANNPRQVQLSLRVTY